MAATRSVVVSNGARSRERPISRAIAPRVALLAVLPQDRREPLLGPLVHDRARVELLGRVHPHVERRVVRIGEAALARVHLHRGDAQVHVEEVRAQPLRVQRRQDVGVVAGDEARRAGHLGREAGELLRRLRVAVDADQLAARADPVRHQPGVAARAEGAVDRDRARLGVEHLDQLAGQDRHVQRVMSRRSVTAPGQALCGLALAVAFISFSGLAQRLRSQTSSRLRTPITVTSF